MASEIIQIEDGDQVIQIEVPEGVSDREVMEYYTKNRERLLQEEDPSALGSFLRSAANSAVFEGGDEALAALGVGEGETYSERQRDLQKTIDADYQTNPVSSALGSLGGAGATAVASLFIPSSWGTVPARAGQIGKSAMAVSRALRGIPLLAAEGALTGYLGADQDTRGTGAALGAVANPVISKTVGATTRGLQNLFRNSKITPEQIAARRINDLIQRDGADVVQSRLDELGGQAVLMDAIEGGASEARRVGNIDDAVRSDLSGFVSNRGLGQNSRISKTFEAQTGISNTDTVKSLNDALEDQYAPIVSEAYKKASQGLEERSLNIPSRFRNPESGALLPEVQKIVDNQYDTLLARRAAGQVEDVNAPFEKINALKQSADDFGYDEKGIPVKSNMGRVSRAFGGFVREEADKVYPEYEAARNLFKEKIERQKATELGGELSRKFSNEKVRDLKREIDPRFVGDVRRGFASQASSFLEGRNNTIGDVKRYLSNKDEALGDIFTPQQSQNINRVLDAEKKFKQTQNAVQGNSKTAEYLLDATIGGGIAGGGAALMGFDPTSTAFLGATSALGRRMAANALAKKAKNLASNRQRAVAPYIAKSLMGRDIPTTQQMGIKPENVLLDMMMKNFMSRTAGLGGTQITQDQYRYLDTGSN
ncbi:MAG: hypothetical protein AAF621_00560 [Pseudomonadota bacterium]